jgi:hypothetical protein
MSTQMLTIIDIDPRFHLASFANSSLSDRANSGLSETSGMGCGGKRRSPDLRALLTHETREQTRTQTVDTTVETG